jgi:hypothetical protein
MRHTFPAVAAFAVVLHLAGCDREMTDAPADYEAASETSGASMADPAGKVSDNR